MRTWWKSQIILRKIRQTTARKLFTIISLRLFKIRSRIRFESVTTFYITRTRVFVRKYLTCAIDTVSVEDLRESKFEALALYCKSFAKLEYLLLHKSYSWLLLLLSWRKILAQKWKYLKISESFSRPFLISSLSEGNHDPKYKIYPAVWNRVSDGKLHQKLPVTSSQKVTLCSNNDFVKCL